MKTFRLLANHTSASGLVPALYCHHPLTPWDIHQSHCWISQPLSQSDCAPHWVLHGPANVDQQVQHLLPSRSARKGHQHLHPAAATSSPVHLNVGIHVTQDHTSFSMNTELECCTPAKYSVHEGMTARILPLFHYQYLLLHLIFLVWSQTVTANITCLCPVQNIPLKI